MHTGNTTDNVIVLPGATVYPCAYREHGGLALIATGAAGLSLCIQGTHYHFLIFATILRFIPVHTGNTDSATFLSTGDAVYPCAYREHPPC